MENIIVEVKRDSVPIRYFNKKEKYMDIILTNIQELELNPNQKLMLRSRFLLLHNKYKYESKRYQYLYNFTRVVITFGSISIPSLLSIEAFVDKSISFWFVWSISLIVSILNAYVSLFKIDKSYYSYTALFEQMCSEFWQYNSLCGRYSGFYTQCEPNHKNQFIYFMNNIEKIQMRSIEETYIKVSDNSKEKRETGITTVPPSINKEILNNPPQELLDLMNKNKEISPRND